MKKVFLFIILIGGLAFLTAGYLVYVRYSKNPEQIVPYPFQFESPAPATKLDAPILITGDRMGAYLAKFKEQLAVNISVNLAKPIKVQSMARLGHALHRTLHELRSLSQWPQILIYQGGSEEFSEKKFNLPDIPKIRENFKRYNDDRIETVLILRPELSRLVYEPIGRIKLPETPVLADKMGEEEYIKRLDTELMLYEQELRELVSMARDRNSLLILTTTPINLDPLPRAVCEFTGNMELEKEMLKLREELKAGNPKNAYKRSRELVKQHPGNARLYYLHGQTSRRVGQLEEARANLLEAGAYDCEPWRATEIHNSIIRKVARDQQVLLFDFAKLVERDYTLNATFFDEIYPQNLYYEKAVEQLGLVIKSILKL